MCVEQRLLEKTGGSFMNDIETPSGKNEKTENFPVEKLLRAEMRPHVSAFYVFARAADDIADDPLLDSKEKIARLDAFASALRRETNVDIPSVSPLRESLVATGISDTHALDLLTAFKRDATQRRYRTWEELLDYCRYSANPVGRHVLALHGVGEAAWPASDALCTALQILNHLQDCADDYRELDRVYLPLELLSACGSDETALSEPKATPALRKTLDAVLDRTAPLIARGKELKNFVPDLRLRIDVAVIGAVAEDLALLLRKRDPLCENVKLSKFRKFCALAFGAAKALVS